MDETLERCRWLTRSLRMLLEQDADAADQCLGGELLDAYRSGTAEELRLIERLERSLHSYSR